MKNGKKRLEAMRSIAVIALAAAFMCVVSACENEPGDEGLKLPAALQNTEWSNSNGDTLTFTKDGVTIKKGGETPQKYTLKDSVKDGATTTLYFSDSKEENYIVFQNGAIIEVKLGGVSETGPWDEEDREPDDGGGAWSVCTVRFYYNYNNYGYNEVFSTSSVTSGKKVSRPASDPEREGYDFTGWYTDFYCSTLFDFNQVIYHSTNIYAGWQSNSGSGSEGDFTFEYTASTLTITGYIGDGGDVNIPSTIDGKPITAIGDSVFSEKRLTSVTIPDSVTSIGYNAFYRNPLTSIVIPESVISIGDSAFWNNQLASVTLGNSVTEIGQNAFSENQLTSITLGNKVISIGYGAFSNNQLTSVIIPDSVTSIEGGAFASNQLTSITIGADVTIYSSSYYPSEGSFGNYFDSIYLNTYHRIAGTYTRPDTNSTIWTHTTPPEYIVSGTAPFTILGYFGNGSDVTIPSTIDKKTVTAIGDSAFRAKWDNNGAYVNQLTSVTFGNNVTEIGSGAFYGNQLSTVIIPDSVTTIGNDAFYGNQIISITIGAGVTLGYNYGSYASFGDGFETAYYDNYEMKGTYTRPDTDSTTWTKQ